MKDMEVCLDGVTVRTGRHTFLGKFVGGVDGANSTVARCAGLMRDAFIGVGIESEVEVSTADLERWRNQVLLGLGSVRGGYDWIFHKADHVSIGVGCPAAHSRTLKSYFVAFTSRWKKALAYYRVIRKQGRLLTPCRKGVSIQRIFLYKARVRTVARSQTHYVHPWADGSPKGRVSL